MMRALHAVSLLCLCLCAASSPAAEPPAGGITTVGGFSYDWAGLFSGARLSAMGGADIAGEGGSSALLVNAAPTPLTGSSAPSTTIWISWRAAGSGSSASAAAGGTGGSAFASPKGARTGSPTGPPTIPKFSGPWMSPTACC